MVLTLERFEWGELPFLSREVLEMTWDLLEGEFVVVFDVHLDSGLDEVPLLQERELLVDEDLI